MADTTWLKELKKGDPVFVERGGFGSNLLYKDKVKGISKTIISLENSNARFRIDTGAEIGGMKWDHGNWIHPDNEKYREQYLMQRKRKELSNILESFDARKINYHALTREQLERLIPALTVIRDEIVPEAKK